MISIHYGKYLEEGLKEEGVLELLLAEEELDAVPLPVKRHTS
jgi:hypothetical protein